MQQLHRQVRGLVQKSVGRLTPLRQAREEMGELRKGLEALERSLVQFEKVSRGAQRNRRKGGG